MKAFVKSCILAAALTSLNASANSPFPFSTIFLFGDSLSDVGNKSEAPETNPNTDGQKLLWINFLAQNLRLSVSPSAKGGNDYAEADAETGLLPFAGNGVVTVVDQTKNYLNTTGNYANPHALYTVIAGANDIMNGKDYLRQGDQAAINLVNMSTNNILDIVTLLHNAGAKYILVGNLPDLGQTPYVRNCQGDKCPNPTQSSQLSQLYNNALMGKLNATGYNIIQIDIFGLLNAIQSHYASFGFLGPYSSGNSNQNIFFDGFHPTQGTGKIFADYVYSILVAPSYESILAEAPLGVINNQNSMIRSELLDIQTDLTHFNIGKWRVFSSGLYNPETQKQSGLTQPGFNVNHKAFIVGANYRFNQNSIFGFAGGRSMGDVNFVHHAGGFNLDENLFSLFGGYQFLDNAYVNATLTYGNIDYSNINRRFMLGPVAETVNGNTTGNHYGAEGNLGYNLNFMNNHLKTGPLLIVDLQRISVNPFGEHSSHFQLANGAFDALQYKKQTNDSLIGGLGWQVSFQSQLNNVLVLPFLQATYHHQFLDMDRLVKAGVTSLPGSVFAMPVTQPDKDFGLVNAGIQGLFNSGLALTFGYNLTVGQKDVRNQAFMINASMPI